MNASIGKGVYSFAEAAKLTGLRKPRIREWFLGRRSRSEQSSFLPGDYQSIDGEYAISFLDLIDVYVAGQLREYGVSLRTLRRIYQRMTTDLQSAHPFCRKELLTDGKEVFVSDLDDEGKEELMEVLSRQKVFPEIILPFLKRIDYDKMKIARRWHIALDVVIDPHICFGKPVVESVSLPTSVLAEAFYANSEDINVVSDWFHVRPEHVRAAVDFERTLAA